MMSFTQTVAMQVMPTSEEFSASAYLLRMHLVSAFPTLFVLLDLAQTFLRKSPQG